MGRRIEVELTSTRDDGSWTWRAAGAKQPKGEVSGSLLYNGAKVGDVVKVDAEFHLDGIEVTEVFAPRQKKERTDLLEMKSRPLRDDELVTTQRVSRGDRRGDRRGGRGRARGEGRGDRRDRDDRRRGPRPEAERRPKPKRLRPKRAHRDALLAEVTEEHRPIVEQVMREGMPGVRAAIEKQNTEAKAAGKPEIDPSPILAIAERNLGPARLAEWRDRADAALADGDELDIRDLRSVVVAGSDVARDDETRALVDQVKTLLDQRLESDHNAWLQDLDTAVQEGRVVRGLRLSSRPVKAGAPLPTEVASKLADQASQALAPDVAQDRWATVLDALAFSPVRSAVAPVGLPAEPGQELLGEVRRLSDRIPAIAALFGVDPAEVPKSAKRRRSPRRESGARNRKERRQPDPAKDRPVPGAEPKPTPDAEQPAAAESDPTADTEPTPTADQSEAPDTEPTPTADQSEAPDTELTPTADQSEAPETEPTADSDQPEASGAAESSSADTPSPEANAEGPDGAESSAEGADEDETSGEPSDEPSADTPTEATGDETVTNDESAAAEPESTVEVESGGPEAGDGAGADQPAAAGEAASGQADADTDPTAEASASNGATEIAADPQEGTEVGGEDPAETSAG